MNNFGDSFHHTTVTYSHTYTHTQKQKQNKTTNAHLFMYPETKPEMKMQQD